MKLSHSFLITLRNLRRTKSIFIINLIGLSTGLAGAFLIYLWVASEWQMDKFHQNEARLYQILQNFDLRGGDVMTNEWTPAPLGEALVEEMPEIDLAVTLANEYSEEQGIISSQKKAFKVSERYSSPDFFKVFSFKLLEGNAEKALQSTKAILISDELARKLFRTTQNLIDKPIEWEKGGAKTSFLIKGIFQKPSAQSSMQFDVLMSMEVFLEQEPDVNDWNYNGPSTYVVLKKGTSVGALNEKLHGFLQKKGRKESHHIFLTKYSNRYLYGNYQLGKQVGGRIIYVRLFSVLSLFILAIACINFTNLSTARATRRMKEIGIKKVVGVSRKNLIFQFLGESILITGLAMGVAIVLVEMFLPNFNQLTAKDLSLSLNPQLMVTLLGITLITGLLAGSYPAFYLSGFNPISILKGNLRTPKREVKIRRGLVIFQFTLSVIMIVSALVIHNQINYIQSKPLGYEREQVIQFKRDGKLQEGLDTFLDQLKNVPGVVHASNYRNSLHENVTGTASLSWEGQVEEKSVEFKYLAFNYDMIETLNIEIKEGRSFSQDFANEDEKIIFNETAIKAMGIEDPIGKIITTPHNRWQIIGVVKDFHFESFYEDLKPCFIYLSPDGDHVLAKLQKEGQQASLDKIKQVYEEFNAGLPFEFSFLDQDYQQFYQSEKRVAMLSQYFAGFAIIISCLGLFGLATFNLERRIKEIGIRKILGSSNLNIVYLLSGDYTKMVLIASIIGLPISYFLLKNWLDYFVYRIDLTYVYFASASILILCIAWLTVGLQIFKATQIKPVDCLRDE